MAGHWKVTSCSGSSLFVGYWQPAGCSGVDGPFVSCVLKTMGIDSHMERVVSWHHYGCNPLETLRLRVCVCVCRSVMSLACKRSY